MGSYIVVNIMCILIVSILLFRSRVFLHNINGKNFIIGSLVGAIEMFVTDIISISLDGNTSLAGLVVADISSVAYFIASGLISYFWFCYTINHVLNIKRPKLTFSLAFIPALILIVIALLSPSFNLLFYIDEAGHYCRGNFYFIQLLVVYSYFISSSICCLYVISKTKSYYQKKETTTLAMFALFPFAGSLAQAFIPGIPSSNVGVAIGLLIVFLSLQNYQIVLDQLTGLSNRYRLWRYFENITPKKLALYDYYLAIFDIDDFKSINDNYGHVEGDKALIDLANILKSSCDNKNSFISRYGGDEFVLIFRGPHGFDVNTSLQNIFNFLDKYRKENKDSKYKLTVSYGVSKIDHLDGKYLEMIEAADKVLYVNKQNKKEL